MDEASAAKLEELHLGAVSEGEEWLRRSLEEMRKEELRVLATAGGVETHSNRNWLPVAELRRSLMKVLVTSTEVGRNKKKMHLEAFVEAVCEISRINNDYAGNC